MTDEALRELLHRAAPESGGVDFDALAGRLDQRHGRRELRPAGWVAAAAVVAAVIAGVVWVLARPVAAPRPTPVDRRPTAHTYSDLVLHDGDRLSFTGEVIAIPHKPVQMCAPGPFTGDDPKPLEPCELGVIVQGLDTRKLSQRQVVAGGITGFASVEGVWRNNAVTVTAQHPERREQPPSDLTDAVPCAAPHGGWPRSDRNDVDAIVAYGRAHPGSIVLPALLHPSAHHVVAYALTSGDPGPVERALRTAYGRSLCVQRSDYSTVQLHAAESAFSSLMSRAGSVIYMSGEPLDARQQPYVDVGLVRVTPALAALAARQPAGLVHLEPWLRPRGR
jgi:hypothetical protein